MKRNILKSILCSLLIVALLAAPASAFAASGVAYIFKVAVSDAPGTYMRSGKSSDNNAVVGSLKNGTKVLYLGSSNGHMLQVMTPSGDVGYVYKGNLATYGAIGKSRIYVTAKSTGVYNSAKKKVGNVGAGVPVVLFSTSGKYSLVRSITGTAAYIPTSALTRMG